LCLIHEKEELDKKVRFGSLEDAEVTAAADKAYSWICSHLSVDALLAKHIHEYVALPPKPVLFYLWIDVTLNLDYRDQNCQGYLIARKRIR
jgi:hypothetical protein